VVNSVYHEIVASAEILMQMATANPTPQYRESEMPLRNSLGWGVRKRPDEIDERIEKALKDIEAKCRPVLADRVHGQSTWFASLWRSKS
jgi:hypothetical protein